MGAGRRLGLRVGGCRWALGTPSLRLLFLLIAAGPCVGVLANFPLFDVSTQIRILLIPKDTPVGSVVYRLRATDSDFDYPLHFDIAGEKAITPASIVRVVDLPCSKNMSYCQANLVLARRLEPGRVYNVRLRVRDSKGDSTTVSTEVQASNFSASLDVVFPHRPNVVMVPEDTKPGTELEYVIAKKNPRYNRHSFLELWGSDLFKITQKLSSPTETNASIILTGKLDYEVQTMYTLQVYALDAFAEPDQDTRNIASLQIAVVVEDVQDTPPEFVDVPPVTELRPDLRVGDEVVRIRAEDGDKGKPRAIRYGLVAEGNPLTPFFAIDETSGIIRLAKPLTSLTSIARAHQPLLLTIMAEEVRTNLEEPPAMASTVTIALLLGAAANNPPYFDHKSYVTRLPENSPQGTPLIFGEPYTTIVRDDDVGKLGVFSLELINNPNGTFEIMPGVGQQKVMFVIHVRNSELLDYESRRSISFKIVAKEVANSSLSDTADVLVYIDDVNDNVPQFAQAEYRVTLPENVTAGTTVTQVRAVDVDTGLFGEVRYTAILGPVNTSLSMDPETGIITVATDRHALDREIAQEYRLDIEARDEAGDGLRSTVPLVIRVLDVNDETPSFDREPFEFILAPDRSTFSSPAFVHATDRDAEAPNNVVRYEILSGNVGELFQLNRETGEVTVRKPVPSRESVITLNIRAYDLGVPLRWSHGVVRIYPPDTRARTVVFIVPGSNPDIKATEEVLSALTGGTVTVRDVRPYEDDTNPSVQPRSQVTATVLYGGEAVVDVEALQRRLRGNKSGIIVNEAVREQKADSSSALMWILIVLGLLLLLALLLALLCCLCHGCPLYIGSSRRKTSRVHSAENAHLVVRETIHGQDSKGVQAGWMGGAGLKEAWSAGTPSTVTAPVAAPAPVAGPVPTHGHPGPGPPPPIVVLQRETPVRSRPRTARSVGSVAVGHDYQDNDPNRPAIVFTRRLQAAGNTTAAAAGEQPGQLFVEDLDGTEYRVLDPSRFVLTTAPVAPAPSQTSAVSDRPASPPAVPLTPPPPPPPAVHHILLVERNHPDKVPDEDVQDDPDPEYRGRVRQPMYLREGDAEIMRMVTAARDGSAERPDRPDRERESASPERVAAAAAAAVGRQYVFGPDASFQGKDMIMRRFIEDQRYNDNDHTLQEPEQPDTYLMAGLSELMQQRQNFGHKATEETRDSLLQRFLDEESRRNAQARRRILATLEVEHDTQSLPPVPVHAAAASASASASMGTQTNVDSATQTDAEPHLLRPPRRRVRSDNDESPSATEAEEDSNGLERGGTASASRSRSERRRRSRKLPKAPRRHIKTPILEENESSLEAAERRVLTARASSRARAQAQGQGHGKGQGQDEDTQADEPSSPDKVDSIEEDSLDDAQRDSGKPSPEDVEDDSAEAAELLDDDPNNNEVKDEMVEERESPEEESAPLTEAKTPSKSKNPSPPNASSKVVSFGEKPKYVKGETYMSWYKKKREEREKERKRRQEQQEKSAKKRPPTTTTVDPMPRMNRATEARRALATGMRNAERSAEVRVGDPPPDNRTIPPVSVNAHVGSEPGRSAIFQDTGRRGPPPVVRVLSRQVSEDDAIRRINAGGPLQVTPTRFDDDVDSGIAMASLFRGSSAAPVRRGRNALMEKKSIFTIAYDEMHTEQLRPDSTTPPS